jgi:digeranylgeranylglycerophospholipid reductase
MEYDVVIIGAGPAGLMAARELKKENINFLIIDKKKEIGLPLKCGESTRLDGFVELFDKIDYDFVKNRVDKFEIKVNNTKIILDNIDFIMLDRPKFENWLAEPIKSNLQLGNSFEDISLNNDFVEIKTSKGKLKSKMVILAYGCRYDVQKRFGLLKKIPYQIPCYGGIFQGKVKDKKILYFCFDDKTGSAGWVFPKESKKLNSGIGILPCLDNSNIKDLFKKITKKYGYDINGKPSFSGVFPTTGPINKTYSNKILVCGNAAGQVFAGIGEGIYFSLKAGQLAGKNAAKAVKLNDFSEKTLKEYEQNWKRSFGKLMKAGIIATYILFIGYKIKVLEKMFKIPTKKEWVNMFIKGKIPIRARIIFYLLRIIRKFHFKPGKGSFMLEDLEKSYSNVA